MMEANKNCLSEKPFERAFNELKKSFSKEILETSGLSYHQQLESLLHELAHMIIIWPSSYKKKLATNNNCNSLIYDYLTKIYWDIADKHEVYTTLAVGRTNIELNLGLNEHEIMQNACYNICDKKLHDELKSLGVDYLSERRLNKPIVKSVAGKLIKLLQENNKVDS